MRGVHAVHVAGERGEPVHVVPHAPVGRVEQVGAVLVDLRAGLLVHVAVRVAANVVAHVDDLHANPEPLHGLLGHGQAEQARAHDHQIGILRFRHNHLPPIQRPIKLLWNFLEAFRVFLATKFRSQKPNSFGPPIHRFWTHGC